MRPAGKQRSARGRRVRIRQGVKSWKVQKADPYDVSPARIRVRRHSLRPGAVRWVSFFEALAYCRWFTDTLRLAACATITINQVHFMAGRRYGPMRLAAMREHRGTSRVLGWIERHGLALVVGSRFVYGLGITIPAACGAMRMSPLAFTLGDLAGPCCGLGSSARGGT